MTLEHPGKRTVLVADDEPLIRELLGAILSKEGYTVLSACNADEALKIGKIHGEQIILALLDRSMPGAIGDLAACLNGHPRIRIVLMSGYTEADITSQGVPYQLYEFLQKPFTRQIVMATVHNALAAPPRPKTDR